MANNHFVFSGLAELKIELRALPTALRGEATGIVMGAATRAKATVGAVYDRHRHTGNLSRGLSLTVQAIGPYGTAALVKSRAPHAWLFERGSQARHYTGTDKRGRRYTNADRGAMWGKTSTPPTHVFVRSMISERRKMYAALKTLMERRGLTVTGQAA